MRTAAVAVALASLALAPACREAGAADPVPLEAPPAPAPLRVTVERADLVFRYVDPTTGEVATASTVDGVPARARRQVLVFDASAPAPPGYEHVADLSGALPVETVPTFGFALRPAVSVAEPSPATPAPASAARAGRHEVVMFTTRTCGYCRKARAFFKEKGIAYSEYDVETDPEAERRMSDLAEKAGVHPSSLRGVPIVFVDGQPIVGFDKARIASLLGV